MKTVTRWLAIARIAHKYQIEAVADWAFARALKPLGADPNRQASYILKLPDAAAQLLRMSLIWGPDTHLGKEARVVFQRSLFRRAAMRNPTDPLTDVLPVLDDLGEKELLAQAYYYLLEYRPNEWMKDRCIRGIDRRRMLYGYYNMSRSPPSEVASPPATAASNAGSEARRVQDRRLDAHEGKLWSMFDVDGLRLDD